MQCMKQRLCSLAWPTTTAHMEKQFILLCFSSRGSLVYVVIILEENVLMCQIDDASYFWLLYFNAVFDRNHRMALLSPRLPFLCTLLFLHRLCSARCAGLCEVCMELCSRTSQAATSFSSERTQFVPHEQRGKVEMVSHLSYVWDLGFVSFPV